MGLTGDFAIWWAGQLRDLPPTTGCYAGERSDAKPPVLAAPWRR